VHTDDSIQVKYFEKKEATLSKAAFTFTFDAGCEYGGGVSCGGGTADAPSQTFLGFMLTTAETRELRARWFRAGRRICARRKNV
jgi:hypothetical protein